MSFYDFSGYANNIEQQPSLTASKASMENFLQNAWASLNTAYEYLQAAEAAQKEDDNNCDNEELNREKEGFVERINLIAGRVGELQVDIMKILREHNRMS